MSAMVMRARLPSGARTHTVTGHDGLPIAPVEAYLRFLRQDGASPHTVQAYARGLAAWWVLLADQELGWEDFPAETFGAFLSYLRTGDLPSTSRVGPAPTWLSPASVTQRSAAVLSFYRWHAAASDLQLPMTRLYTNWGRVRTPRYVPMLAGIADHGGRARPVPLYRGRRAPKARTPVLTPAQVALVIAGCAPSADTPTSRLVAARDRLLFTLLPETGLRIGEALALQHRDVLAGTGDTPRIRIVPRDGHPHGCRVKGGRSREIFVSDALEGAYSAYVWELVDAGIDIDVPDLGAHWVFVNIAREPRFAALSPDSVYDTIEAITTRADGALPQGWSPHWMRHTHATALLLAGTPPHVVMRRLGHADYQTTLELYGWVSEEAEMRTLAEWQAFASGWRGVTR